MLLLSAKHSRSLVWWGRHHVKGGSECLLTPVLNTLSRNSSLYDTKWYRCGLSAGKYRATCRKRWRTNWGHDYNADVWKKAVSHEFSLLLLHLHRRKAWLPRNIQHQQEVRIWVRKSTRKLVERTSKKRKPKQNDDNEEVQGNSSHDLPEWLEEFFKHGLVDESVPEHRDASGSSHECSPSLPEGPKLRYLPENQDYKRFLQKNALKQSCLERKNGDLITADHKVLSEGCESRNNHRHAVVVQDMATQWIQSYPCETQTSLETRKSFQKFLEPDRKPKVIYTDNSFRIWQILWRSFLESFYVNATQIGNEWDCWESSAQK